MITNMLRKLVPADFKKRIKSRLGTPSQEDSLERLKRLGFDPEFCIDIGAYEGTWTDEFKRIFPGCAILMFEGLREKESKMLATKAKYPDVDYHIVLLGADDGRTVTFNKYETASSVFAEHHHTEAVTEIRQLTTLDSLTAGTGFARPAFIKLDAQGYELEILRGGGSTLSEAEFVLMEVSFLDIYLNCPLALEAIRFMGERGLVIYDICSLMRRPLDRALYQSDILFVRKDSHFRSNKHWK